jgi:hypothetical protein
LLATTVQQKRLLCLKFAQEATIAQLDLLSQLFAPQATIVQVDQAQQLHVHQDTTVWDQVIRIKNVPLVLIALQHLRNRSSVHQVLMVLVTETTLMLLQDVLNVDVVYSLLLMLLDNV